MTWELDVLGIDYRQYEMIGAQVWVHKTATVGSNVTLGERVTIGPGACIGKNGFGYERNRLGHWDPKPHKCGVVVADNVHIGANTCIDRGSWRDTYIGPGCRIDNLVHIAHNVHLERNVVVVAGALLAGSVWVGDGAWIGLGAKVNQRVTVAEGAFVGSGAVVTKNVPSGKVVAGVPAKVIRDVSPEIY